MATESRVRVHDSCPRIPRGRVAGGGSLFLGIGYLPVVSIVVPFFGLTYSILRILKGNPQKGTTMETVGKGSILLMIEILHYLKEPKLWELRYIPYYG